MTAENVVDHCRVCGGLGEHRKLDGQLCPRLVDQLRVEATDTPTAAPVDLTPEVLAWWEELAKRAEIVAATLEEYEFEDNASEATAILNEFPALLSGVRSRDARIAELEAETVTLEYHDRLVLEAQHQIHALEAERNADSDVAFMQRQQWEDEIATLRQQRHDALEAVAARDAVIETIRQMPTGHFGTGNYGFDGEALDEILSTAPSSMLAARDAEKWDEGVEAEGEAHYRDAGYGNVQHPTNPYRAGADQ
jgi:hypothetical protein